MPAVPLDLPTPVRAGDRQGAELRGAIRSMSGDQFRLLKSGDVYEIDIELKVRINQESKVRKIVKESIFELID